LQQSLFLSIYLSLYIPCATLLLTPPLTFSRIVADNIIYFNQALTFDDRFETSVFENKSVSNASFINNFSETMFGNFIFEKTSCIGVIKLNQVS